MKDWFLFLAGTCSGILIFSVSQLFRELYGDIKDGAELWQESERCKLCNKLGADGWHEGIGAVCAECEVELYQVEKQLYKIHLKQ